MQKRPLENVGTHLSLSPDRYPDEFRHVRSDANLISILYGETPDEWRRTWRTAVGWTPRKEAILDVTDLSRSTAAAGAAPSTRMIPNRDIALTTFERPVDPGALVETVQSYLVGCTSETILYVDHLEELLADADVDAVADALAAITDVTRAGSVRAIFCLDPTAVSTGTIDRLRLAVDSIEGDGRNDDDVERAVEALRRDDPTNYGYARRHWREAQRGIDLCDRNYPQARQIHELLDEPETTSRTMGATLKAFVTLGVIDTWSETVGSTRYDLTAYDADLLDAVGVALDATD